MSSNTGEWCCTECKSYNAYQETFNDDEIGHIMGCKDCGYYYVYSEDAETVELIEDYQRYDHQYAQDDKENNKW